MPVRLLKLSLEADKCLDVYNKFFALSVSHGSVTGPLCEPVKSSEHRFHVYIYSQFSYQTILYVSHIIRVMCPRLLIVFRLSPSISVQVMRNATEHVQLQFVHFSCGVTPADCLAAETDAPTMQLGTA